MTKIPQSIVDRPAQDVPAHMGMHNIVQWLNFYTSSQLFLILNTLSQYFFMKGQNEQITVKEESRSPQKIEIEGNPSVIKKQIKKWGNQEFGAWSSRQQIKYLTFLRKYYYIMRASGLRYHYRIFNTMAEFIGTRNSAQCNSHHQKMLKKHKNLLENIVFKGGFHNQPIAIGQGQTHLSHKSIVREGIKQLQMGDRLFLTLKVDRKLLIVINQQLIAHY